MNRHVWHMIILTAAVCIIAVFIGLRGDKKQTECTVALVPRSGMTILSENPVQVERGGSAAFRIQFDENCFYGETDGMRYENGTLYVDDIVESRSVHYAPARRCKLTVRTEDAAYVEFLSEDTVLSGTTAQILVKARPHYIARKVRVNEDIYSVPQTGIVSFQVYDDSRIGVEFEGEPVDFSVYADPAGTARNLSEQEAYFYGNTVTLRSECPSPSVRFDGWSKGAFLSEGGTLLSREGEIRYTLVGDTELFANFTDLHTYTVTIDPNGGSADAALTLNDCSAGKPVYLPADRGVLHREGFALIGYNTLPDGSGQHYSLASPMLIGHENVTLYAEWLQETSGDALSYYTREGYAMVKGVSRAVGDTLVIPSRIGGVTVKGVEDGAFRGNNTLETVVIPLGITYIGSDAFSGCENLSTVYLPDTLKTMEAGAFEKCPAFRHLRVLTQTDTRVYEKTLNAALADQYLRLLNTQGERIILVAGSSGSFGLDSSLLAEHYPDYDIINFSGSYLFGMLPIQSYVSNNIHPGDIVIFAPEYYGTMYANSLDADFDNWMYLESNYNMLDDLDQQAVKKSILGSFVKFLNERRKILPGFQSTHGVYKRSAFNEYGDLAAQRSHKKDAGPYSPETDIINSACVKAFSAIFTDISARGGICLFSFPPVSDGNTGHPERLKVSYDAFTEKLMKAFEGLPCTVISSAADYIFPMEMFYDNKYHMTTEGARLRTNQLIADLDAYMSTAPEGGKP